METKTQHTQGPWRHENGKIYGTDPERGEILIADTAPGNVALAEMDEANAKLMAAAPELLAACEYAERILDSYKTSNVGVHYEALRIVRSAIAKASA